MAGLLTFFSSCASSNSLQPAVNHPPTIDTDSSTMSDGSILPISSWIPDGKITAVALALHGFNDYRNAFAGTGPFLAKHGILTYAFDQRGFGKTRGFGLWAGTDRMISDLRALARLLRFRHPDHPLFLMGESMGAAVIMAALGRSDPLDVNGVILIAPAVWTRDTMPWYQRVALWIGAHAFPSLRVSGKGLGITPSDNIEMLRALSVDPLVIKKTRIDTIDGLTNLMDEAAAASGKIRVPGLILYGDHDEIIPKKPVCRMLHTLPPVHQRQWRLAVYPDGYHMLTRDLEAAVVRGDIAQWINHPNAPLPSGHERRRDGLAADCSNLWRCHISIRPDHS